MEGIDNEILHLSNEAMAKRLRRAEAGARRISTLLGDVLATIHDIECLDDGEHLGCCDVVRCMFGDPEPTATPREILAKLGGEGIGEV
jgi:hypothetical protein